MRIFNKVISFTMDNAVKKEVSPDLLKSLKAIREGKASLTPQLIDEIKRCGIPVIASRIPTAIKNGSIEATLLSGRTNRPTAASVRNLSPIEKYRLIADIPKNERDPIEEYLFDNYYKRYMFNETKIQEIRPLTTEEKQLKDNLSKLLKRGDAIKTLLQKDDDTAWAILLEDQKFAKSLMEDKNNLHILKRILKLCEKEHPQAKAFLERNQNKLTAIIKESDDPDLISSLKTEFLVLRLQNTITIEPSRSLINLLKECYAHLSSDIKISSERIDYLTNNITSNMIDRLNPQTVSFFSDANILCKTIWLWFFPFFHLVHIAEQILSSRDISFQRKNPSIPPNLNAENLARRVARTLGNKDHIQRLQELFTEVEGEKHWLYAEYQRAIQLRDELENLPVV